MSIVLRLLLIAASVLTTIYFLVHIRRSKVQIEDTIFWFVFSLCLIALSLFPGILYWAADLVGVISPVNFLYLVIIFVLLMRLFALTLKVSMLEARLRTLAQKQAIRECGHGERGRPGE